MVSDRKRFGCATAAAGPPLEGLLEGVHPVGLPSKAPRAIEQLGPHQPSKQPASAWPRKGKGVTVSTGKIAATLAWQFRCVVSCLGASAVLRTAAKAGRVGTGGGRAALLTNGHTHSSCHVEAPLSCWEGAVC